MVNDESENIRFPSFILKSLQPYIPFSSTNDKCNKEVTAPDYNRGFSAFYRIQPEYANFPQTLISSSLYVFLDERYRL